MPARPRAGWASFRCPLTWRSVSRWNTCCAPASSPCGLRSTLVWTRTSAARRTGSPCWPPGLHGRVLRARAAVRRRHRLPLGYVPRRPVAALADVLPARACRFGALRPAAHAGCYRIVLSRAKNVEATFPEPYRWTAEVSPHRAGCRGRPGTGEDLRPLGRQRACRDVAGERLPVSVRLMQSRFEAAEVHHRPHGIDGAVRPWPASMPGSSTSPEIVSTFCRAAPEVLENLEETTWDRVLAVEPLARPPLNEAEFDNVLEVLADISDLKSPWFSGHSRGVGDPPPPPCGRRHAAATPRLFGGRACPRHRAQLICQQHLGQAGAAHRGGARARPAPRLLRERMLRRPAALAGIAAIASSVHERLDGSGYHRGIRGPEIPLLGRYLAAADVYHALLEERPYRPAREPKEAAAQSGDQRPARGGSTCRRRCCCARRLQAERRARYPGGSPPA